MKNTYIQCFDAPSLCWRGLPKQLDNNVYIDVYIAKMIKEQTTVALTQKGPNIWLMRLGHESIVER